MNELRRSAAVLQSTFNSMAEAVLVIDAAGAVVLSNAAAEQMLGYRAGMTVHDLRKHSVAYHAEGTPISADEMPSARVLRGEQFDGKEIIFGPAGDGAPDSSRDQRPAAARRVRRDQRRRAGLP